ncbi:MAG TPA: EipA family protein, partial [Emcibacteraceae bacterium]|nr:EipA family protein [Emcibacteraceae bacterium]
GDRRVYWKGPSIGIDVGANGSRVFALVYNLNDTEELFQRFPAVEGSFYYVAGFGMNYQQVDEIIIAPIRLGVGLRAGVNLGYLHFTKERSWIPF